MFLHTSYFTKFILGLNLFFSFQVLNQHELNAQSTSLQNDKDVSVIAKAISQNKGITKWKDKKYYPSLNYIQKIYPNYVFNDSLLDLEMLKKPDDNTLVITYLLFHLDMMHFQNTGKDDDSLCRKKLEIVTAEEALFRYYEFVFMSVFSNPVPLNKDLSIIDFDLDALGFKNSTEKMIFFIAAANRLNTGIETLDVNSQTPEKNINYVSRCPTINKQEYMNFTLLEYKDFPYNGSTFSYKIEQFEYVKEFYNKTYETKGP